MSPNDPNLDNLAIDPPDNQGGTNVAAPDSDAEAALEEPQAATIDPPDNQGGGGAA